MFDIDKLFLSRFYYDVKNGKASTSFKEGSHEYYANRLLSDYIALLKDSKSENEQNVNRTAHSNHASIDGDTKLLKDIIKDIEEGQAEKPLDPFTPYSLWANASTKTEFITGKFGIGPFALNNNSHILTMLYGVKFKQDGFLGQLGMYRLDQSSDRYGNSILSWISGLINAHVDVAKDPYIARLNVNSYTYNLVNLMIRTGFGKDTFYFTTQPIMVEMATAYNNAASQYGSESSRSKSRRQNEAVEEVVYNFVKSNFSLPNNVGTLKQANKVLDGYFEKVRGISVDDAIQILLSKNNDILHQISKKHIPMNGHARMYKVQDNVNLSAAEIQYLVYRAKDKFLPYEQQLSDLVKYSKIDTRKQGKNVTEQMAYREGVNRLFNLPGNDYGLFEDLSDYYNDSYIKDKTNNALDLFVDIMGSFTIESTNQFLVQVDRILNQIGEKNASADMRKAVSKQIMNYIRAGFFNTWALNMNINIKSLVSGNNTISDRLEDIRIKIMTDPAYSDMRSVDGSIKNYLLASLVQGFQHHEELRYNAYNAGTQPGTYQDVKFVKTLNFMDSDHVNEDDMAEAWDELLNDTLHPEIRMFARDLIMYAYITSGGNSGNNLFKYIPNSWKLNSYDNDTTKDSYAQYMQDQLELYQNSTDELPINVEEIILNNWFDDKFIPTIKADGIFFRAKGYYTGRYYYEGRNAPEVSIPIMLIKENADVELFSDEEYIKIKRNCSDPHSPRNYTIYKKLSYTTNGKLIYVMVDPKGNKFPHDTVYEMRRNDASIQESTAIAGISAQFTESMMIAKQAMGIQGNSVSDIITAFLGKLSAANNVGTEMAMINAFTKDPVLAELMKDAAGIHLAKDRVVEIEQPALNKQEAEKTGARTYEPSAEAQNDNFMFDTSTAEFYSGGAIGSDTEWATMAKQFGIKVKEYTPNDYDSLSDEWKEKLDKEYRSVAIDEGRKILPANTYAGKLVRRDMMQADKADAVFAIVNTDKNDGSIQGGTAYAVRRAWLRKIPVYYFDQADGKWYETIYESDGEFASVSMNHVPKLTQHAAVVGTRLITDTGKLAIKDVFNATIKLNTARNVNKDFLSKLQSSSIEDKAKLLEEVYNSLNCDFKDLAHKVFSSIAKYGIDVVTATPTELGAPEGFEDAYTVIGDFHPETASIRINTNFETIISNAPSSDLYINIGYSLLHEAIHALTTYAINNKHLLSKEAQDAVSVIEACYEKLTADVDVSLQYVSNDYYGLKNSKEMVAELANPAFRKILRNIKIFDRIINAVAKIINLLFNGNIVDENSNLEENLLKSLNTLIDTFDKNAFNKSNMSHIGLRYIRDNFTPIAISSHNKIGKLLLQAAQSDEDSPKITIQVSSEEKLRILSGIQRGDLIRISMDGGFGMVRVLGTGMDTIELLLLDSFEVGLEVSSMFNLYAKTIGASEDLMAMLTEKLILLNLDENNNQDPMKFIGERPYSTNVYSLIDYLSTKVKQYLTNVFKISDKHIYMNNGSLYISKKSASVKAVKLSIADTSGYVNDFSITELENNIRVTPRHTDLLQKDTLAAMGKELRENQCK